MPGKHDQDDRPLRLFYDYTDGEDTVVGSFADDDLDDTWLEDRE